MTDGTPSGGVVYVIDDDPAVRDSLCWLIESVGLEVAAFGAAQAFLDHLMSLPAWPSAGCVVADLRLPGMSGLDLQDRMKDLGIDLPIIFITGHGDVPLAVRAMRAGAIDFIEKPFSDELLLGRIHEALVQHARQRQAAADRSELERRFQRLTPREREVMELIIQGRLNKQIAADLGLSHKTVEVHRAHVMEKMEAASLADLVRMAMALGLIQDLEIA
ncbi:MAG TPA: response regulator transcription factor [Phycisphaeraceae bacterium]